MGSVLSDDGAGGSPGSVVGRIFIVGANKAGTTSLHRYLDQHPGFFMSHPKEPLVLARPVIDLPDGEAPSHTVRSEAAYAALFADARSDQILGESSTAYLTSELASTRIAERWPDALVVAVLRDPAARAFSEFRMRVDDGTESLTDFDAALDAALVGERPYLRHSRYVDDVVRWRAALGVERTRFFRFEDLTADPAAVLAEIVACTGADASFTFDVDTRFNTAEGRIAPAPARPALARHARRFARSVVPAGTRAALRRRRAARERAALPTITPAQRARVVAHCTADTEALEALLDLDLAAWRTV